MSLVHGPSLRPAPAGGVPPSGPETHETSRGGPRVSPVDRWVLGGIRQRLSTVPVRFALWDGSEYEPSVLPVVATVTIFDRPTLYRLAVNPDLYFGEAYMAGRLDVTGDLVALMESVNRSMKGRRRRSDLHFFESRRHRVARARSNIHHHYDIGNDFYRLWLDEELLYTCAYFPTPDTDLEAAQRAKMELVCRKLALSPGDRVLETGCGWGALAFHMARHHGARVRAFNISHEQIEYARSRAKREGLGDRVEFIEDDWRNAAGQFDVFVSVGMLEHVGLEGYAELRQCIESRLARDRGRGLMHFIGRTQQDALNAWIRKRIFPGAYPPTLSEVMTRVLEPANMTVLDIENLRLHYAKTLWHWRTRFEAQLAEVARMFDDPFVRAWRLYLAGSEAAFLSGWLQLFQITFAPGAHNQIPWTRADLYRDGITGC